MITTRIGLSIFSILAALGMMAGATYAFFTDADTSVNNRFDTGELSIDIDQSMVGSGNLLIEDAWLPGEDSVVRFNVENDGDLPVFLRGLATGEWLNNNFEGSDDIVKVTRVEYLEGGDWVTLANNGEGIEDFVYYATNQSGNEGSLIQLNAGSTEQFRLTVELDESAGNDYQNRSYLGNIVVQARQTTSGANWPGEE